MAQLVLRPKPYKRRSFDRSPLQRDYSAIGEFITATSIIEVILHRAIRRWLDLDDSVARALIGEPRHGELIDKLKFAFQTRYAASNQQVAELLTPLCVELSAINDVRSVIAHKPCWTDGVEIAFSNSETAPKQSKRFVYVCTSKQLRAYADWALLVGHTLKDAYEGEPASAPLQKFSKQLASLDRSLLPAPPPNKSQPTAKQTPPHQPSRKSARQEK